MAEDMEERDKIVELVAETLQRADAEPCEDESNDFPDNGEVSDWSVHCAKQIIGALYGNGYEIRECIVIPDKPATRRPDEGVARKIEDALQAVKDGIEFVECERDNRANGESDLEDNPSDYYTEASTVLGELECAHQVLREALAALKGEAS